MPAPKSSSSSGKSKKSSSGRSTQRKQSTASAARSGAKGTATSARKGAKRTAAAARQGAKRTAASARGGAKRTATQAKSASTQTRNAAERAAGNDAGRFESLASLGEQLANRILRPLDLVMLTRERIQDTLDEAAERGRVTRDDANELVSELVQRGRQQTDDILSDIEQLVGRGRDQIGTATKRARRVESVDRLVRTADRARRTVGVGPSFPILGYDELTAGQVEERITGLTPAELRKVRDYERRHANRKSVLMAIEKALG